MLVEVRVKNCFAFQDEVVFSMKANMKNKKLGLNVHKIDNFNVLKSAGIYGPNNSGKTCMIKCIRAIQQILLNQQLDLMPNIFSNSHICKLGVTFLWNEREFSYDFTYDTRKHEFTYECFMEIKKDRYGNEKKKLWLERDSEAGKYDCLDAELQDMMPRMARNHLLCYLVDTDQFEHLNEVKQIITDFAEKIDLVNMYDIPMSKTIDMMKNEDKLRPQIVEFIKQADLYLDDFSYMDDDKLKIDFKGGTPDEKVLEKTQPLIDQIRLFSMYKGVPVPSFVFDSTGTKKIEALASYVVEALEQGRILIIDELDSGLHFTLTRAIVAMFNNDLNTGAQLIFTTHDVTLMDCKNLLRKEQIWFINKDDKGVSMYSLAEFTAANGIRDTTDVIEKYRKGAIATLPEPDLIDLLIEITSNGGGESADE